MTGTIQALLPRQSGSSSSNTFLNLVANPFQSQVQQSSVVAALGYSFGLSALLTILFCFLRPRVSYIYAPRAKHADSKHAPPLVGKGLLSWVGPVISVREAEMIEKIGVDATIFLRFLRMLRSLFLIFTVLGCAIMIPVNLGAAKGYTPDAKLDGIYILTRITPQYIIGSPFWAHLIVAYLFTAISFYFLWRNYAIITRMRRQYYTSPDYQSSLHARSIVVTHIPQSLRNDEGLVRLVAGEQFRGTEDIPKATVARNVKDLPELIDQHKEAVHSLEKVLAAYLKNPNRLPASRPTCTPAKSDRAQSSNHKVDAIEYLTGRIQRLEEEIKTARETVDRRNPLPYGFASYRHIEDAHAAAYAFRKKRPQGAAVRLAPRPIDLIWKNLPISRSTYNTRRVWTNIWMIVLTLVYVAPNVLTAVFLADLSHLGQVWPAFQTSLDAHPTWWALVQGILAPTLQNSFYLVLPTIFRRFLSRGGDKTKTSRERHVFSKLFAFYVFNNLIVFSVFSSVWQLISNIIKARNQNILNAIERYQIVNNLVFALCNISPYWVTWELLRNLSAAIDLLQVWPLLANTFAKKFLSPSPRQLVELTAPQPFLYAEYYATYLLSATAALVFSSVQPLVLPSAACFIVLDYWLKKYLLQYVFITRIESGGSYWRTLFNRFMFALFLYHLVTALLLWSRGTYTMLFSMIPLPIALVGFKVFCAKSFDTKFSYYSTVPFSDVEKTMPPPPELQGHSRNSSGTDRLASRFGHPALYQKLIVPMVNANAQHLLPQIYKGRLDDDDAFNDTASTAGYSDVYMTEMSSDRPGKSLYGKREPKLPFEFVADSELDFENFKKRAEFRAEFGGEGELYGRAEDQSRPTTPGSMMSGQLLRKGTRDFSPDGSTRNNSRTDLTGTSYPRGYHAAGASGLRGGSYASDADIGTPGDMGMQSSSYFEQEEGEVDGRGRLLSKAAAMGRRGSPSGGGDSLVGITPLAAAQESPSDRGAIGAIRGYFDRAGVGVGSGERGSARGQYQYFGSGGGGGFGSGRATPQDEYEDDITGSTSYNYFRHGGARRPSGHMATGSGDSAASESAMKKQQRPGPGEQTRH